MQPVIVMPLNDPLGIMFPHLRAICPSLKRLFAHAAVSVSTTTQRTQAQHVAWLASDPFFHILRHPSDLPAGQNFAALYRYAAALCMPEQVVHLCFIDRVAFALQSAYRTHPAKRALVCAQSAPTGERLLPKSAPRCTICVCEHNAMMVSLR